MFAASKSGRAAAVATDPYFPYVPLLLETTSTNGQQNNTFLDSSTNNFTITRNGTPTQGSVTPYWPNGYWSNYFSGSSDYISAPSNAAFTLGTGDFTIEAWIYPTSNSAIQGVIGLADSGSLGSFGFFYNLGAGPSIVAGKIGFSNVGGTLVVSTGTVPVNTWTHVAFSRASGSLKIFFNGALDSTTAFADNSTKTVCTIGRPYSTLNQDYFPGYVSNARIVKGVAVYTGNFTVPTTPLAATQSSGTNISAITGTATSLLTCQSNRFIDNSANNFTITANGTPRVQAFQPFSPTASYTAAAYGGSGYFNGSTDYLSAPSNAAFALGTGDFTIECWIYLLAVPTGFADIAFIGNYGTPSNGFYFNFRSSGTIGITDATTVYALSATALVANTWYHVAAVRSSGSSKIYVNGVGGTAVAFSGNIAQNTLYIGNSGSAAAGGFVNGYISNHRVVKGTAVYTANFTPPTSPLTAITNTSLLLNYTNAGIYDAAVQNNAITVGDAQASTTQSKWSPTSMKFDGTGDYLTMPTTNIPALAGAFTIEAWVYFSAISGTAQTLCGKWNTSLFGWLIQLTSSNVSFSYGNGTTFTAALNYATTLTSGTWYYLAITRNASNSVQAYINGSAIGSAQTASGSLNSTAAFAIGINLDGTQQPFNGYIQDFRITNGVARTITTPTAAFPTR